MPIHTTRVTRRQFVRQTVGAGVSLLCFDLASAAGTNGDPSRLALLSDTHIPEDRTGSSRGQVMADNLARVVKQVVSLGDRPSAVTISGDCAYQKGQAADYRLISELLEPLDEQSVPIHLLMGNHDNRDVFYQVMAQRKPRRPLVQGKHVAVLEAPQANWFLLDTLMQVNQVTGQLGQGQLEWLAEVLQSRRDKPAIVMGHHNPQFNAPEGKRVSGLQDTAELFEILDRQPHVKAYVYGHTHVWHCEQRPSGLHLINLPPVGYVFRDGLPMGWVDASLQPGSIQMTLLALDSDHPESGKTMTLQWRG